MDMDFSTTHKCKICDKECSGKRSVANHLSKSHGVLLRDYIVEHMLGGCVPTCKCGCGEAVSWHRSLCKFNEYIVGHNAVITGFSSTHQPTLTEEQVQSRNTAIRNAYAQRSNEISDKISTALKTAWGDSNTWMKFSEARKKKWQDDQYRRHMSKRQKESWSGPAGELRRQKVFTEEFSRKISESNMKRDVKKTSAEEQNFYQHILQHIDPHASSSYWHNGESVKCFDVKTGDTLIEFDGVYWHGLDRSDGFTQTQLTTIVNDIRKNRLAREMGRELIRIRSDDAWQEARSIDDLRAIAYHHQAASGDVIRQGTFNFINDTTSVLTRSQVIRHNEPQFNGQGRQWTGEVLLPLIRELFYEHAKFHGWMYPKYEGTIRETLDDIHRTITPERLHVDESISSKHGAGTALLKSRFKSFWHVQGGPVDAFWRSEKFDKVLQYRLGLNNSKPYTYTLDDGEVITCRETFDINVKNVRFGLIVQRNSVSFFKPHAAAMIWRRALGDVLEPRVWDPSGGFGGRMLGFATMYPHGYYLCTEPAAMTYSDLKMLADDLMTECHKGDLTVMKCGSEEYVPQAESLDCVFTSPPYFAKEKYFDEPGQCWRDHNTLDRWMNNYLIPTFKNAYIGLKRGHHMIINIDDDQREVITDAAKMVGFVLTGTWKLAIGSDHFRRKNGMTDEKFEPIFVFTKP